MRIFISLSLKVINRKIFHINNCNIFALRWAGNIQYWLFCWKNLFYYTSTSQTDQLSRLWSPMNFIFCKPIQLTVQTRCYRSIRAAAELIFEMKNRQHKSRRMKSNYSKFVVKHQRCQCEERVSERVGNWTQKNERKLPRNAASVKWSRMNRIRIVVDCRPRAPNGLSLDCAFYREDSCVMFSCCQQQ